MKQRLIVVLVLLALLAVAQAVFAQDARAQAGIDCRGSNYELWEPEQCGYGTLIVRTNETWNCNGQLMGDLPIKVVVQATRTYDGFGVTINNGCNQPANWDPNRIALILDVRGTGNVGNTGPNDDSWKMRPLAGPGPQFLTMTIRGECGRRAPNAHSDSGQLQIPQTSARIKVFNFRTGNFDGQVPTCQGAGGAPFWSSTADVDFIGARVITCNHALNGGAGNRGAGSEIIDSDFRTGSANHPNCAGIVTSNACWNTGGMLLVDVTCDSYPFAPGPPLPPPPPPPPPPAPAPTLTITQTWGQRIRVDWPALQNVERFNFSRDSTHLSHTLNGNTTSVVFGRVAGTHSYCVEAVYASASAGKSCVVSTK